MEGIESVKEFRLRAFFADDELNVVDEQNVDAAIALAKFENAVVANRIDDFVHEAFRRNVGQLHAGAMCQHVMPNGVHQVRLA